MASRLLGSVSAGLGVGAGSLVLDTRRICVRTGLLGLPIGVSRANVCPGGFHADRLYAARLFLSAVALHSDEQPVHPFVAAAALGLLLLRQLLWLAVRQPRVYSV